MSCDVFSIKTCYKNIIQFHNKCLKNRTHIKLTLNINNLFNSSLLVVTFPLLITFANSLDLDQARQNVRPDLDPNCLTLMVFLKYFLKKLIFSLFS